MTTEKLIRANEIQNEIDNNNKILKELEYFKERYKKTLTDNTNDELVVVRELTYLLRFPVSQRLMYHLINSISSYCNDTNAELKSEFEKL